MDIEQKKKVIFRSKKLKKVALITALMLMLIIVIFVKGYLNAKEKYEDTIAMLEQEVDRLSDPVAVYEEASKEVDIRVISAEIQEIGELATVEYLYTDAGKFEDPAKLFGKEIPFSFTTKSFIAKWDGVIKAGIEIGQIKLEKDDTLKEIVVYMPKAQILSHEIDDTSIETLDEKNGLFNPIKIEDIREFDTVGKEEMEKRAIENGLLIKAQNNAEVIIERLVNNETVKELEYSVRFEIIE